MQSTLVTPRKNITETFLTHRCCCVKKQCSGIISGERRKAEQHRKSAGIESRARRSAGHSTYGANNLPRTELARHAPR